VDLCISVRNIKILVKQLPDPRGKEGERGVRWCKPYVGRVKFDPDAITNVDGGCAQAATFGEGKVGALKIVDGGGASRRSQRDPRDRLGL
jgi:hypothetical protein